MSSAGPVKTKPQRILESDPSFVGPPCPVPRPFRENTPAEVDAGARTRISAAILKRELALYKTKWWDYRLMSPGEATILFARIYREQNSKFMMLRLGPEGVFRTGINRAPLLELPPTQLTGLWKARQCADEIGCPYEFFLGTIINECERTNWSNLPRVTQLYSDDMRDAMAAHWAEQKKITLQVSDHPHYSVNAFQKAPYQLEYQAYLVGLIKSRPHPEFATSTLLFKQRRLHPQVAKLALGETVIRNAHRLSR